MGWPGTRTRRTWPSGRRSWPPLPAATGSRRRPVTALARLVLIVDQFEQVFTLNPGPGRGGDPAGVHHGVVLGRREPGRPGAGTARAGGDRGARGFLGPVRRRSRAGERTAGRAVRRRADDRIRAPGGDHRAGGGGRAAHRSRADRHHLGGSARGGRGPLGRSAAAAVPGDGADLGTPRGGPADQPRLRPGRRRQPRRADRSRPGLRRPCRPGSRRWPGRCCAA